MISIVIIHLAGDYGSALGKRQFNSAVPKPLRRRMKFIQGSFDGVQVLVNKESVIDMASRRQSSVAREYFITNATSSDLVLLRMVQGVVRVELFHFDGTVDEYFWYGKMLSFAKPPKDLVKASKEDFLTRVTRHK